MAGSRKLERQLFESERNFRLLVRGITDYAIYMLTPEGFVANWNAGAERIKGYKASEIVGKHFSVFYPPEDRATGLPDRALAIARKEKHFLAEGWHVRRTARGFLPPSSSIRSTKSASWSATRNLPATSPSDSRTHRTTDE